MSLFVHKRFGGKGVTSFHTLPQDVFYNLELLLISPTLKRLSFYTDSTACALWETATEQNSLFPGAVISRLSQDSDV